MVSTSVKEILPFFLQGTVVKGLGRGSKELGIPTANLDDESISKLSPHILNGVYACAAKVEGYQGVFGAATSVGKNIHFGEIKRTVEVHILHKFCPDLFYGHRIYVCFLNYIRKMKSFNNLDELIHAINMDILTAKGIVNSEVLESLQESEYFNSTD